MLLDQVEVKPKTSPTQVLNKDWSKRRCLTKVYDDKSHEVTELIHDFKVRDDDVWIVTLPKCGTTWMQELVWLVLHNYDFDLAKQIPLEVRSPFIEIAFMVEDSIEEALDLLDNCQSPRIIKTHRPLPLLPAELWHKKTKTIYVIRDPKDALVSAYHFGRSLGFHHNKSLSEAIKDDLDFEEEHNAWFEHALEFYALRDQPWVLYTSYEKMKTNLRQVIMDVCAFLEKPINEDQMNKLLKHLSFEEMKKNPQVSHVIENDKIRKKKNLTKGDESIGFVRKGQVGTYKEELPAEIINRLDVWVQNSLKPHNMTLKDLLLQN